MAYNDYRHDPTSVTGHLEEVSGRDRSGALKDAHMTIRLAKNLCAWLEVTKGMWGAKCCVHVRYCGDRSL